MKILLRKGAPTGNQNARKDGENNADTRDMGNEKKRPANLKDNIHTILHGTPEEKRKLQGKFFHLADTPDFMKKAPINLTGDYFTVGYGAIRHHKGKDKAHNLSEQNWLDLQDAIKKPFAIAKYNGGYNLYTKVKVNGKNILAGVEVKNIGRGIEINNIKTAFGKNKIQGEVVYTDKNITPTQAGLLGVNNLPPLQPAQGVIDTLSPTSPKKSSENIK